MNIIEELDKRRRRLSPKTRLTSENGMVLAQDSNAFRRILAIGDIHGSYSRLMRLFDRIDFCPQEDLLIFLGDIVDRGSESAECLRFLMDLQEESPAVAVLTGNHEAMLMDYFEKNSIREPMNTNHGWITSGGAPTYESLRALYDVDAHLYRDVLGFLLSLDHIAAIGEEFLFTHAGFYPGASYEKQYDSMLWLREEFLRDYTGDKTVVVGHTPVQCFDRRRRAPLVFSNGVIDCDTGSFLPDGAITCVDVKARTFWQSEGEKEERPLPPPIPIALA